MLAILYAAMVFVYPLAMPVVTLAALVYAAAPAGEDWRTFLARSAWVTALLAAVLSPSVERTGAGSFALPWWLQKLAGSPAKIYALEYVAGCLAALAIISFFVLIWRLLARSSAGHR